MRAAIMRAKAGTRARRTTELQQEEVRAAAVWGFALMKELRRRDFYTFVAALWWIFSSVCLLKSNFKFLKWKFSLFFFFFEAAYKKCCLNAEEVSFSSSLLFWCRVLQRDEKKQSSLAAKLPVWAQSCRAAEHQVCPHVPMMLWCYRDGKRCNDNPFSTCTQVYLSCRIPFICFKQTAVPPPRNMSARFNMFHSLCWLITESGGFQG